MKLLLVDYKGKWDIIIDENRIGEFDFVVGEISKEEALRQVKERKEACDYYGIPAIITSDPDLIKAYE